MTSDDLDLVETEDLLDALERRFPDGLVFAGTKHLSSIESTTLVNFRGGIAAALGCARYAEIELSETIRQQRGRPL